MPAVHGTWGLEHPWGLKGGGTKRHMPSAAIALTPTGAPRGWVLEGGLTPGNLPAVLSVACLAGLVHLDRLRIRAGVCECPFRAHGGHRLGARQRRPLTPGRTLPRFCLP